MHLLRSAGGLERIRAGLVYMHLLRSTYYVVLVVLERIRAGSFPALEGNDDV